MMRDRKSLLHSQRMLKRREDVGITKLVYSVKYAGFNNELFWRQFFACRCRKIFTGFLCKSVKSVRVLGKMFATTFI